MSAAAKRPRVIKVFRPDPPDPEGGPQWITFTAARAVLDLTFPPFKRLLKNGAFAKRRIGRWQKVLIDPKWTRETIYDAWLARRRTMSTEDGDRLADRRDLERHWEVHRDCRIDPGRPVPGIMAEEALRRLMPFGHIRPGESRALLPGIDNTGQGAADLLNCMAGRRSERAHAPRVTAPSSEELAALHPVLTTLPGTSFEDEDLHAEPNEAVRRKLGSIGALRPQVVIWAYSTAGTARRPDRIASSVGLLARFCMCHDALSSGQDATDGTAIGATLTALLDGRFDGPGFAPAVRAEICAEWLLMSSYLKRLAALHDPDGGNGLRALVPAEPPDRAQIVARISALRFHHRAAGRARRKVKSDKAADRLFELEDAASLRMEQLIATGNAARAAVAALGDNDRLEFEVDITVLDEKGRLRPGVQRAVWEAVREHALFSHLMASADEPFGKVLKRAASRRSAEGRDAQVHFRFKSVKPVVGTEAIEPWFVSLFRYGLLASPRSLPARLQRQRLGMMQRWRLQSVTGTQLPGFIERREFLSLWRWEIERHRLLVDIEGFEHCMRYAHLAMRLVLESYCRFSELVQTIHHRDGWDKTAVGSRAVAGFLAWPKLSKHRPMPEKRSFFPVDDRTFIEMNELCATTIRRCGHVGGVPWIEHLPHLRWKAAVAAPLVFSFNGVACQAAAMQPALRLLLAALGPVTFHDLRHAAANSAREAGVPPSVIAKALKHEGPSLRQTLWYARRTQRQLRRDAAEMIAERSARIADTVATWETEKEKKR